MRLILAIAALSLSLLTGCAKPTEGVGDDTLTPEAKPALTLQLGQAGRNGCLNDCARFLNDPKLHRTCQEFCECVYKGGQQNSFSIGELRTCFGQWTDKLRQP
jgi:hypothetical protein